LCSSPVRRQRKDPAMKTISAIGLIALVLCSPQSGGRAAAQDKKGEKGAKSQAVWSCADFSPDNKLLLVGYKIKNSDNSSVFLKLSEVAAGEEIRPWKGHKQTVTFVAFLPSGKEAVSASLDKTIRIWDVAKGVELRRFKCQDPIYHVMLSVDGKFAL